MLERSQSSYSLLRQFREFYAEVARLRRLTEKEMRDESTSVQSTEEAAVPARPPARVLDAQEANSSVAVAESPGTRQSPRSVSGEMLTQQVWREMANYLDQRMYEVKLASTSQSHDLQQEMIYVMAAFADEIFVCLEDWPGRDFWRDRLMEIRFFRTQIAGEEIFRRIDRLLTRRDFGTEELAAVYLTVLALGFRGQYLRDPAMADSYRKNLFNQLLMTNPGLRRQSPRLFPEAYLHTVVDGAPVRLPEPKTWWLMVAGVVGVWLVLSTIAWLALTSPVRKTLDGTMALLDRVTNQQAATSASADAKWAVYPFGPLNGGFRLELPASLPLHPAGTSGPPLLIGVQAMEGSSAGSAAQIEAWLATGTFRWSGNAVVLPGTTRPVASVTKWNSVPEGMAADQSVLYFLVTPKLAPSELFLHSQLAFPAPGKYDLAVESVTLYLPDKSTAGVP